VRAGGESLAGRRYENPGFQIARQSGSDFLRPSSKWRRHLKNQDRDDNRFWEVSVLFHLRDAFRAGDMWLAHSRRYGDMKQVLVPMAAAQQEMAQLTMPLDPHMACRSQGEIGGRTETSGCRRPRRDHSSW
jgi:hypothetical protein